jgi:hypothetical protein
LTPTGHGTALICRCREIVVRDQTLAFGMIAMSLVISVGGMFAESREPTSVGIRAGAAVFVAIVACAWLTYALFVSSAVGDNPSADDPAWYSETDAWQRDFAMGLAALVPVGLMLTLRALLAHGPVLGILVLFAPLSAWLIWLWR